MTDTPAMPPGATPLAHLLAGEPDRARLATGLLSAEQARDVLRCLPELARLARLAADYPAGGHPDPGGDDWEVEFTLSGSGADPRSAAENAVGALRETFDPVCHVYRPSTPWSVHVVDLDKPDDQ